MEFIDLIEKILEVIEKEGKGKIEKAAGLCFGVIKNDGLIHVFASGHSHMFAEEMFYRSGGLAAINPILYPPLMQHVGAVESTKLERKTGLAKEILEKEDLRKGEVFIVVSNSGINSVPIEAALYAKSLGLKVIGITSLVASLSSASRHSSGLHLCDVCDIVIDNHVPIGDALYHDDELNYGAPSSIACSYIAQSLVLKIIELYKENNLTPPIFLSANVPGGDEANLDLIKKYQKRVKPLK